jgi:hypothetical protein
VRGIVIASIAISCALPALAAEQRRTIAVDQPVEGITRLVIDCGVGGRPRVVGSDAITAITGSVEVSAKKASHRKRNLVEQLDLDARRAGGTLYLEVKGEEEHHHDWGEEWVLSVPKSLALSIDLGVGNVEARDLAGGVEVDLGVGEVLVEGEHAAYGRIDADCRVGDVELRTPAGRQRGDGFIGKELRAEGAGKAAIEIDVGVGEVTIRLR